MKKKMRVKKIKISIPQNFSLKVSNQQVNVIESTNWRKYGLDFPDPLIYTFPDYIKFEKYPHPIDYTHLVLDLKEGYEKEYKKYNKFGPLHAKLFKNRMFGYIKEYIKIVLINGVGYRFNVENNKCMVFIGFAKPICIDIPKNINIKVLNPTKLEISSNDNYLLGKFANDIREIKPQEPYKLKGIYYMDSPVSLKTYKKISK